MVRDRHAGVAIEQGKCGDCAGEGDMSGVALVVAAAAVLQVTESCQARLGPLASAPALPPPVDGMLLRNVSALEKLRKRQRDGSLIIIKGGDFTGWDFRKADIGNMCFIGTKLTESDWRGVRAPGLGFIDTDLTKAQLAGAALPSLLLRTATLADVDARDADFAGARIDGGWSASFNGLKLDRARLQGAVFACGTREADGCPFDRQNISARGADFSDVVFTAFAWWGADLEGARFDNAQVAVDDLSTLAKAKPPSRIRVRFGTALIEVPGDVATTIGRLFGPASPPVAAPRPPAAATAARFQPGSRMLFVRAVPGLVPGADLDPAWAKVAPYVARSASARIAVRVEADGRIAARGLSTRAGESCRFDVARLTRSAGGLAVVGANRAVRQRPEPLLSISGGAMALLPPADAARRAQLVPGCTDPAAFGTLLPLAIDAAGFDQLWNEITPAAG
jgi:uncharacterized protein YjbI with pentapeptide repeats